ncbi:alpha/beta fold hydrolase [Polyangium sp. y55x31]|uniref:alpha/beta fold hydrolase n=1 Tax=Polyangium sp. y55x31 TaxID=3042688 RepID=UPI0024832D24|nr:alpha/beta fold hydrolase [Polyangium sp. y55x31]MDI1483315.1 alpha/beta fold hydrolase [Polyangium sp. y55x31]
MPFAPPPPLPGFLAADMPLRRRAYRLEHGEDAGKLVHFVDHGPERARPALFVHGNPTWSFLWRKVIAGLPELRCIAPDLLGFGLSDRLARLEDHSIERHAAAVAELVTALDLRDLVLVGQDWGGPIGVLAGSLVPDRIAAVVLANTSVLVPARPRGTLFHRFARVPVLSDVVFRGLGFPQNLLAIAQGDRRSIRGATARAYTYPLRSLADRIGPLALARMVPDGPDHPSLPALHRAEEWLLGFTGPVALVWGERDPILGKALARHQRAFPRATVTATQAGHFLQEEVPEEIAAAVEDVIERLRRR